MLAAHAASPAPAPTAKSFAPGDLVDGRYRIESYLGGGGMASVYRATHIVLEQVVAIKVISPAIREVPGMAQRFLREARAATKLKTEHVARVSDVGTMADGAPYMVMEYLEGRDLDAVLEAPEDISVEDAVDYVLQACEALAEVHGLGIVHRDLKPANLFLTCGADGLPCVKLIDFGISRTESPMAPRDCVALTQPDTVIGSPRYMSPEQMESSSKADSRSDIYGVGAVLYELLTRVAPHEGATLQDIYSATLLRAPEAPSTLRSDVPGELDAVILQCLRVNPAERYVDTAELACALAPFGPAGSAVRADAIARVLETARARTHDSGVSDGRGSTASGSHVRRRISSSAHSVHKRRIMRSGVALAVLAVVGLAIGGRALYSHGRAYGAASAELALSIQGPAISPQSGASPQRAPAVHDVPDPPPGPALAPAPAPAPAPVRVAEPEPAPEPATLGSANSASRATATSPAPAAPERHAAATGSSPPPFSPSRDERTLFEDRK